MINIKTISILVIFIQLNAALVKGQSWKSIKSKEAESYFRIGYELGYHNKYDSALIYLNKADSIAPNNPLILHERGLTKSSLKKYDEAFIDLNKSIELTTDSNDKKVRLRNRASLFLELNRIKEACEDLKNAEEYGLDDFNRICK